MTDKKIFCPCCEKWLHISEENYQENIIKRIFNIWCKHCKKVVRIII